MIGYLTALNIFKSLSSKSYVITPFSRLEANTMTWLDLGAKSGAQGYIISDWGSNENTNPFILTLLGTMYILKKIEHHDFSLDDFIAECSNFVLGRNDQNFEHVMRFLVTVQGENKYFHDPRIADQRGPFFPSIFLRAPDSNAISRFCGAVSIEGLIALEHDARDAVKIIDMIKPESVRDRRMHREIKALCRRVLAVSLRAVLCYWRTWDSGSIWHTEAEIEPRRKMLEEYLTAAAEDLEWHKSLWDEDNLTSCRDRSVSLLEKAIFEMHGSIGFRDNARNHFPPAGCNSN